MITYETLARIKREEDESRALTRLPEGFFESVASYMSKKVQAAEGSDSLELENAKMILGDIMKSRDRKIMSSAMAFVDSGLEPANLSPEEKSFFDQASSIIMQFRAARKRMTEPQEARKSVVAFLSDVPRFVGTDMRNYGPFSAGDIANLPEDVSRLLVEKGIARGIGPESG